MVASEEVIPAAIGLPMEYITYLAENPECTAEEVGNEILTLYGEAINDYTAYYSSDMDISEMFAMGTMSLIDLSMMEQADSLIGDLWERIYYSTYSPSEFASLVNITTKCESYGGDGSVPGNLIDLRTFLHEVSSLYSDTTADDELLALIDDNVVSISGRARNNSCGMSIYFPSAIYPQTVRSSYESMLNYYDVDYTEAEINEIVQEHIGYSFDGYIDNIDFIDGYYWYAAFLEVRFSGLWTAEAEVWSEVTHNLNPAYSSQDQVSASDTEDIEYTLTYDAQGNITLDITSGRDSVLSVESSVCYYYALDNIINYTLFGSEAVYPDAADSSSYTYNPDCEWIRFDSYILTVFQIEDTVDHTIFATPANINGEWSFIYIYYEKSSDKYSVLYCAVVDPASGVATSDVFSLQNGDSIEFLYYTVTEYPGFDPFLRVRGLYDPFEYNGEPVIERDRIFTTGHGNSILLVNFLIRDSFGNAIETEPIEIVYDENNEVASVSEAQDYLDYSNIYDVTTVWG